MDDNFIKYIQIRIDIFNTHVITKISNGTCKNTKIDNNQIIKFNLDSFSNTYNKYDIINIMIDRQTNKEFVRFGLIITVHNKRPIKNFSIIIKY